MTKNIQDGFLDRLKESQRQATLVTTNGYQMKGRIIGHDQFTILMDVDGVQNLVYKSAISTVKGA